MLATFKVVTTDTREVYNIEELERLIGKSSEQVAETFIKRIQIPVEAIVQSVETIYEHHFEGHVAEKEGTLIVLQSGTSMILAEPFEKIEQIRQESERLELEREDRLMSSMLK